MRLPLCLIATFSFVAAGATVVSAQTPPPPQETGPPVRTRPAPVKGTEGLAPRTQTVEQTTVTTVSTESAPAPLGFESDIYCFGYLSSRPESFPARVVGAENLAEQIDYFDYDLLYVNGGYDRGFSAGAEFWLVTPEEEVFHPVTRKSLGRFHQYRGRGRIENVEGRAATLRVTSSCTDIPLGSYLKPFEPVPIPLGRKTPSAMAGDPPSGKATGHIVYTPEGLESLGQDHTVFLSLGYAEGIEPGDFLTVFRYARGRPAGREIGDVGANWVKVKETPRPGADIPRTYLGEIAVLTVGDHWAIGRITDSYRLIEVGDEVELK